MNFTSFLCTTPYKCALLQNDIGKVKYLAELCGVI